MADSDGYAAKLPQKARAAPAHPLGDAGPEVTSTPLPIDSGLLGAADPPQAGAGLQRALARADGPGRVRMVRQLQRSQGNAYIQHLIAPVQRVPTAAPPAAPQPDQQAAAPAETWSVPAGLVPDFIALDPGPITQKSVAAQMLFLAATRMTDLKDELDEGAAATLQSAINGVQSQRQKLAVDGNLTHSDVVDLNVIVPAAKSAFDTALQTLRATISQTLTQMLKDFGSKMKRTN